MGSILKEHEIEVHLTFEKGFLLCNNRPSPKRLFELKSYLQEEIEITGKEPERLLHPEEKTGEEIKTGSLVEVTSGVYQKFKGIVRRRVASRRISARKFQSDPTKSLFLFPAIRHPVR